MKTVADYRDELRGMTEWCLAQDDLTGFAVEIRNDHPTLMIRVRLWIGDDCLMREIFIVSRASGEHAGFEFTRAKEDLRVALNRRLCELPPKVPGRGEPRVGTAHPPLT